MLFVRIVKSFFMTDSAPDLIDDYLEENKIASIDHHLDKPAIFVQRVRHITTFTGDVLTFHKMGTLKGNDICIVQFGANQNCQAQDAPRQHQFVRGRFLSTRNAWREITTDLSRFVNFSVHQRVSTCISVGHTRRYQVS